LPLRAFLDRIARVPSITSWTRLEPRPREGSLARSLQAQVRDPLWMLARQWQVGEFLGDDAGSPIQATLGVEQRTVTTYRPGADDAATVALDPTVPVEVHVEREPVALRLRGAVQLGLFFETAVREAPVADPAGVIAAFRTAFPIAAAAPDPVFTTPEADRFRALAVGRVTDGEKLFVAAAAVQAGQVPPTPLPPEATNAGVPGALAALLTHRRALFSQPAADSAWQAQRLDYQFALGSPAPAAATGQGGDLVLSAADFPGGHLDWYSFSLEADAASAVTAANPAQITTKSFDFLPNHVTFRGMPDARWWNFEDRVTDFGQLDAEHVDLAKLLVMEFALVYGNDWFQVPVPVDLAGGAGMLSRVTTLVVTDTFGVRTLLRPSEQTTVAADAPPWSMFKLSGADGARSDFILMAPTLGIADDGDALEEVRFLRDEMAAMAWAVEHRLLGELDDRVDAHERYLARLQATPPPPPLVAAPDGPKIAYTLEVPVPDNWIPLVPVQSPQGELFLRRGTMEIPTATGFLNIAARAQVLGPGQPFFVADRIVPRSGVTVDRYFRSTRASDGTTFLWLARRSGRGQGSGWSGLRFDLVEKLTP
jgi:hypothetical protein